MIKSKIIHNALFLSFSCLLFFNSIECISQNPKTRVLFVLDGSGSMSEKWSGFAKFDIARELLFKIIDSVEQTSSNVEFGLRVFGHTSPRVLKDCKDSKLEAPFAKNNSKNIQLVLNRIKNQGHTPIAYSLFEAINDFPDDRQFINIIVLITDGIETCEGDPCAVTPILIKRNISLKPFIIGLGMGDTGKNYFDCVGTYYDASNKISFANVMNVVISQAMNTTSAQVNLLDVYGEATETDVEITFYDNFSGEIRYQFIHSLDLNGNPDSVLLSAIGKYDITVHTVPPVFKNNIELSPGKHNIIAIDAPQGTLLLKVLGRYGATDIPYMIRKTGQDEIIDVHQVNSLKKLLVGIYDLEVLTLPPLFFNRVIVDQSKETAIEIPVPGNLSAVAARPGIASIYRQKEGKVERIYEIKDFQNTLNLRLLPGKYQLVYRPHPFKSSHLTQFKEFTITSGNTTSMQL